MRKILFALILTTLTTFTSKAQSEWVSASIGNGLTPNKVDLFIQTTNSFDARTVDNLVFTLRIPVAGNNNVIATITPGSIAPAFAHLTFTVNEYPAAAGGYYYYLINGIGTSGTGGVTIPTGTSFRVMEITLDGGSGGIIQLANIENDIPGNTGAGALIRPQFYIQNNTGELTNQTAMFYGTAGAVPSNNTLPDGDDFVGTATGAVLPVNFSKYNVSCNDKGAILTWSTSSELNSARFEIQRSTNGSDWKVIDNVTAAGNSTRERSYQYLHLDGGSAFYRIRQVDLDGQFTYTPIERTNCKASLVTVTLYPVPAVNKLNVVIKTDKTVRTELRILDIQGKVVRTLPAELVKGSNNIELNVSDLATGHYMLISTEGEVKINEKFTIAR